jgi:hypothetical protein
LTCGGRPEGARMAFLDARSPGYHPEIESDHRVLRWDEGAAWRQRVPGGRMFNKSHQLELAARQVALGREIVERQRARIALLKADGVSTKGAEYALDLFLCSLAILEEQERELRVALTTFPPQRSAG